MLRMLARLQTLAKGRQKIAAGRSVRQQVCVSAVNAAATAKAHRTLQERNANNLYQPPSARFSGIRAIRDFV